MEEKQEEEDLAEAPCCLI